MSSFLFRLLLRLLPRRPRRQYGDQMTMVFADLARIERREAGAVGVGWLLMKETGGLVKFSVRERLARLRVRASAGRSAQAGRGRWDFPSELRWAWRGVRARGWRAVFVIALLGTALAASATMFSVADSLLFNRQPFPDSRRIISIRGQTSGTERRGPSVNAQLLAQWRGQSDLLAAAGGYMRKTIFLTTDGISERVPTADLTVGMLDVLGVAPSWGRAFTEADLQDEGVFAALISEGLARRRFGSPQSALGKRLDATGRPLLVVGVMSAEFAFPDAAFHVWRAFDPAGPLTRNHGVTYVARLAASAPVETSPAKIAERAPAVGRAAGLSTYTAEAAPQFPPHVATQRRTLLLVLLGAALCLMLAACANATSLELANAVQRARTFAVHLALGAQRSLLARLAAVEGLVLVAFALTLAFGLASLLIGLLAESLPDSLRLLTQNPISLDLRVVWFMIGLAVVSWLLACLPPIVAASRSSLMSLLKTEDRSSAVSAVGGKLRRGLTVAEVALAVTLITGGLLYVRSYYQLLAVEKGFDSHGLAQVSLSMPVNFFAGGETQAQFTDRLMRELAALPGVEGVTNSSAPPSMGDSPTRTTVEIDGKVVSEPVFLGRKWVDPEFFQVVGLPLKRGRLLIPNDPDTEVVISDSLARRLWPGGDAVGHTFKGAGNFPTKTLFRVVGVVGDFRTGTTRMPDASDDRVYVYSVWRPPATAGSSPVPVKEPQLDTGGSSRMATVTVRMGSPDHVSTLAAAVRRFSPGLESTVTLVDDLYARQNTSTRLASQVVGAFSILAFLIAIAGVYGVMAFLVAGRTREIGIRMALGADRRDVSRLVLGSAVKLVIIGAVIGIATVLVLSRWVESQFFGVTPTEPLTHLVVAAVTVATAVLATWHPARQAARVDPAITLRAE